MMGKYNIYVLTKHSDTVFGLTGQFIIRSCDEHCLIESSNGCQSFLTDFKKVLIEEEANATYNISSCHASCCNDADLCNQIDLSKHLPAPGLC